MLPDLIWTLVAFLLTIFVLSYVLGDNELFRLAIMIFVGVSAGYAAVTIINQILMPRLIIPLITSPAGEITLLIIPGVLGILLLFKLSTKLSALGNPSMAFLTGVGAAVAIGGAITGTIFGQINGAIAPFDLSGLSVSSAGTQLFGGIILLAGTIASLGYFHFGARKTEGQAAAKQSIILKTLSRIGQIFIAITLGALFAGVLAASLTALIERLDFLLDVIKSFFS